MIKTVCDNCGRDVPGPGDACQKHAIVVKQDNRTLRLTVALDEWIPMGNKVEGDDKGMWHDGDFHLCRACVTVLIAKAEGNPLPPLKKHEIRSIGDVRVGQCVRGHHFPMTKADIENLKEWFGRDLMGAVRTK